MKYYFPIILIIEVIILLIQIDFSLMKMSKNMVNNDKILSDMNKGILYEGWLAISTRKISSNQSQINLSDKKTNTEDNYLGNFRINTKFNPSNVNLIPTKHSFYFRLADNLLYYSELKDFNTILDSIHIKNIKEINKNSTLSEKCFILKSKEQNIEWDLCSCNKVVKTGWLCALNKLINNQPCDPKKLEQNRIQILTKKIVRQPLIIIPVPSPYCNEKWDYQSNGDNWECDCKEGKSQSPVDIPDSSQVVKFYNKTLFDFYVARPDEEGKSLKMIFEDYKIKIKGNFGRLVSWNLIKFEAYEVQFHTKSEHKLNGQSYDLEVQIYYRAVTPGYIRRSAAIAILFQVTPGSTNYFFDRDINILNMPDSTDKVKILKRNIDLRHLFMDDEDDTYNGFSYYEYEGSLTSPPCQEEITWYVVSTPLPISYTTVEYFKDILRPVDLENQLDITQINIENNIENIRNIQNFNGRLVYYFEDCDLSKKHKKLIPKIGHYEKVREEITKYYYVNDLKPSGIPNSFVVNENEAKGFMPDLE